MFGTYLWFSSRVYIYSFIYSFSWQSIHIPQDRAHAARLQSNVFLFVMMLTSIFRLICKLKQNSSTLSSSMHIDTRHHKRAYYLIDVINQLTREAVYELCAHVRRMAFSLSGPDEASFVTICNAYPTPYWEQLWNVPWRAWSAKSSY